MCSGPCRTYLENMPIQCAFGDGGAWCCSPAGRACLRTGARRAPLRRAGGHHDDGAGAVRGLHQPALAPRRHHRLARHPARQDPRGARPAAPGRPRPRRLPAASVPAGESLGLVQRSTSGTVSGSCERRPGAAVHAAPCGGSRIAAARPACIPWCRRAGGGNETGRVERSVDFGVQVLKQDGQVLELAGQLKSRVGVGPAG